MTCVSKLGPAKMFNARLDGAADAELSVKVLPLALVKIEELLLREHPIKFRLAEIPRTEIEELILKVWFDPEASSKIQEPVPAGVPIRLPLVVPLADLKTEICLLSCGSSVLFRLVDRYFVEPFPTSPVFRL